MTRVLLLVLALCLTPQLATAQSMPYGTVATFHEHHVTLRTGLSDDRSGWVYSFPVSMPKVVTHRPKRVVHHPPRHHQGRRRGSAAQRAPRGRWVTVYITGYDDTGLTASGAIAGYGRVAVDPSVFPLGTRFYIPGYGNAVAADTGGAVRGYHVDVWLPTVAQCDAFTGKRSIEVLS